MRRLAMFVGVVVLAFVAVVGGAFVWHEFFFNARVTIRNQSASVLENVRLVWAGNIVWTGKLQPGEIREWSDNPLGEGSVDIAFEADGRTISHECCYVSGRLFYGPFHFTVSPTLDVESVAE